MHALRLPPRAPTTTAAGSSRQVGGLSSTAAASAAALRRLSTVASAVPSAADARLAVPFAVGRTTAINELFPDWLASHCQDPDESILSVRPVFLPFYAFRMELRATFRGRLGWSETGTKVPGTVWFEEAKETSIHPTTVRMWRYAGFDFRRRYVEEPIHQQHASVILQSKTVGEARARELGQQPEIYASAEPLHLHVLPQDCDIHAFTAKPASAFDLVYAELEGLARDLAMKTLTFGPSDSQSSEQRLFIRKPPVMVCTGTWFERWILFRSGSEEESITITRAPHGSVTQHHGPVTQHNVWPGVMWPPDETKAAQLDYWIEDPCLDHMVFLPFWVCEFAQHVAGMQHRYYAFADAVTGIVSGPNLKPESDSWTSLYNFPLGRCQSTQVAKLHKQWVVEGQSRKREQQWNSRTPESRFVSAVWRKAVVGGVEGTHLSDAYWDRQLHRLQQRVTVEDAQLAPAAAVDVGTTSTNTTSTNANTNANTNAHTHTNTTPREEEEKRTPMTREQMDAKYKASWQKRLDSAKATARRNTGSMSEAMRRAARFGDIRTVNRLLSTNNAEGSGGGSGAAEDVNARTSKRDGCQTALIIAARAAYPRLVECLLSEHGASVELCDDGEFNALHCAIFSENFQIVRLLLLHGAKVELEHLKLPAATQANSQIRWLLATAVEADMTLRAESTLDEICAARIAAFDNDLLAWHAAHDAIEHYEQHLKTQALALTREVVKHDSKAKASDHLRLGSAKATGVTHQAGARLLTTTEPPTGVDPEDREAGDVEEEVEEEEAWVNYDDWQMLGLTQAALDAEAAALVASGLEPAQRQRELMER
eukprot:COSAG05_NODE_620_length_8305_cov_87.859493_1_plen_824_part_00